MSKQYKSKSPQPTPEPQPNPFWDTVRTSIASTLIVSVIMGILGWIYFYSTDYIGLLADKKIDNKLQSAIEKINGKLQSTTDKLDTLGQRVAKMEGKLEILKIQSLATQPQKGGNAKKTSEILNAAKKEGTKFEPDLITDAGKQFISIGGSSSNPDVWNAVQAFLDYRSFLNANLAPPTDKFAPLDKDPLPWAFFWQIKTQPTKANVTFTTGERAPAERAAVMEAIGSPLNVNEKFGHEFLRISGSATFGLDGLRMKNIIFKDIKIAYEGGKVEMENVYFVNCTFEVTRRPNGQNFASSVLASAPATTFQAGS